MLRCFDFGAQATVGHVTLRCFGFEGTSQSVTCYIHTYITWICSSISVRSPIESWVTLTRISFVLSWLNQQRSAKKHGNVLCAAHYAEDFGKLGCADKIIVLWEAHAVEEIGMPSKNPSRQAYFYNATQLGRSTNQRSLQKKIGFTTQSHKPRRS